MRNVVHRFAREVQLTTDRRIACLADDGGRSDISALLRGLAEQTAEKFGAITQFLQRQPYFVPLLSSEFQEFPAGARIIEEGDGRNTDFVSLLLAGEVRIETTLNPGLDPQTFDVMGPGTVMGVVGFMDGLPRWGSHTALSPIVCAILTRSRLKALIEDDPMLGAKFLLAMAQKLAEVQRDQIARLKVYAQINRSLQDEIRETP